jgi:hypothetical protein
VEHRLFGLRIFSPQTEYDKTFISSNAAADSKITSLFHDTADDALYGKYALNVQYKKIGKSLSRIDGTNHENITILPDIRNEDCFKSIKRNSFIYRKYEGGENLIFSEPTYFASENSYETLLNLLEDEFVEEGITNPSEEYIDGLFKQDATTTNCLINKMFIDNFQNAQLLVAILHLISHFDYKQVSPQGQTMAIAALIHKNIEVQEYGVKCFENWRHRDGIRILRQAKPGQKWLQRYIDSVIHDLENTAP